MKLGDSDGDENDDDDNNKQNNDGMIQYQQRQ